MYNRSVELERIQLNDVTRSETLFRFKRTLHNFLLKSQLNEIIMSQTLGCYCPSARDLFKEEASLVHAWCVMEVSPPLLFTTFYN